MKNRDYIVPLSVLIQLLIIGVVIYILAPDTYLYRFNIFYYLISWLIINYAMAFYPIKRGERFVNQRRKLKKIYLLFGLVFFSSYGFDANPPYSYQFMLFVFVTICVCLTIYQWAFFWARNQYRLSGGNSVSIVIIGRDKNLQKICKFFGDPYLGYRYKGYFDNTPSSNSDYLGKIEDSYQKLLQLNIEEIFCSGSELTKEELNSLHRFADNHLIKFKVIADDKQLFSRTMAIHNYGPVPILDLRRVPLDTQTSRMMKRIFDLFISLIAIIFVLSWLTPLLFVLIKLESPGPLFFKQKRHGFKRSVFTCYKFRSMAKNDESDSKMAVKNDMRITRIGGFIRRTSIDELPQFFNVLTGDMSVVGPRPHMVVQTAVYENTVDKYLVRHFVKPGITGLAQVKGYRGEITAPTEIRNRIRFDIFYIENWCISMDVKIILDTIFGVFSRDEKAY